MPVRLLLNVSVAERSFSFQDLISLVIRTFEEDSDNLCDEMSQDGVIMCQSSSTLHMMSYILQTLNHKFLQLQAMKTE